MSASGPWPEGVWPSPDEWREWFLQLDPLEQHDAAARVLDAAHAATACVTQDHLGVLAQVGASARSSYTRGWRDGLAALRVVLEQEGQP